MALLKQYSFSILATTGLLLMQTIVLIFWIELEPDILFNSEKIVNQTQMIVGCSILILYYIFLLLLHFIEDRKIYYFIGILVTLIVGQIVAIKGSLSIWPYLIQSKQVMEIISIIISMLSLVNIQFLRSNFQDQVATNFKMSWHQQEQLLLFAAFIIQLVITIYFVTFKNFGYFIDEIFSGYTNFAYDVIPTALQIGSITMTAGYFTIIILNYIQVEILPWISKFTLLSGIATQFYGCSQFKGQTVIYEGRGYQDDLKYPGCLDLTQAVLIELTLISLFFCILALLAQTVEVEIKQTKPQLSQTTSQQQYPQQNQQCQQQQYYQVQIQQQENVKEEHIEIQPQLEIK